MMAYMRGSYYIYSDGDDIHLPSTMPMEIFDELVVMRLAQLGKRELNSAKKRAVENYQGNFGCDKLCEQLGVETTMQSVKKAVKDNEGVKDGK